MPKSDKLRRNVNMLNPVPILFSVVVIRHEYCTQLSVQNIVLRQLKVQRIYNFLVSGVCRWWPISREGNNSVVQFSWFISGQKWKVWRDTRLSSYESAFSSGNKYFSMAILLWMISGFSGECHNSRYIIWSWCKWILVVWNVWCWWLFTHIMYVMMIVDIY